MNELFIFTRKKTLHMIHPVVQIIIALLMISLGSGIFPSYAGQPTEDQVKAAFIYNFAKYTEWPSRVLRETDNYLVIGVLGDDDVYEALKGSVQGKMVHEKTVAIRRIVQTEEAKGCHMLYIGSSQEGNLSYILDALKNYPVLIVGDMDRFAVRGGMINFIREGKYIRFEINVNAIERSGLKVSSQLLKLAKIV